MPSEHIRNPQTEALLDMLKLPYNLDHRQQQQQQQRQEASRPLPPPPERPVTDAQVAAALSNPEEIDLGEDDDGEDDDRDGRDKDGVAGAGAGAAGRVDQDDPMFQPL